MDIVTELRAPPWPMLERPDPPEEGETVQIQHYMVTRQTCKCCSPGRTRFFVRNIHGELLSMTDGDGWDRMCHVLGWYPLPGLAAGEPIPRGHTTSAPLGEAASPIPQAAEDPTTRSGSSRFESGSGSRLSPGEAVPPPKPAEPDPQLGLFG